MPTLHNVTENTKTILKYGGIAVIALIIIILLYRGTIAVKDIFFPTPVTPPLVAYGKLPPITFPEGLPSENLTYEIDTLTGSLPTFASNEGEMLDRMNVYPIFNPEFSLLDLQNAKTTVSKIGFMGTETSLGENVYLWNSLQLGTERTIEMNIVNKNFNYASAFRNASRILNPQFMPDRSKAVASAKRMLTNMNLFPADIDEVKTKTQLLKIQGTELLPAQTNADAQIISVSFFQNDINDFPIFYVNPPYSSLNFYVGSGDRNNADVVQGNFYHQLITDESSTYPLKPVDEAFEELKKGEAFIASNFVKGNTIKIKDVVLGYYASDSYQEYLVPIYVFKGLEDEFYAYVFAIPDEWFDKQ